MPQPEIMVISPPKIINPKGVIANKFQGSEKRCVGLNVELKKITEEKSVHYLDAASVTEASVIDGIHLDENQHQILGEAIAKAVLTFLDL